MPPKKSQEPSPQPQHPSRRPAPTAPSSGRRAATRRARDERVAPAAARPSAGGLEAMAQLRTIPTAADGDLRLLLPDGTTLLHLSEAQARVLDACTEDDPAIVFAWDPAALTALAAYLNAPDSACATPAFVPRGGSVTAPVTAALVQRWIIDYVAQIPAGTQTHIADTIIAPLTLQDFGSVQSKIAGLCFHPGMVAYAGQPNAVLPLAKVLFVADGQRPARTVMANFVQASWGAPAFM